jgi:hypothetical protein
METDVPRDGRGDPVGRPSCENRNGCIGAGTVLAFVVCRDVRSRSTNDDVVPH